MAEINTPPTHTRVDCKRLVLSAPLNNPLNPQDHSNTQYTTQWPAPEFEQKWEILHTFYEDSDDKKHMVMIHNHIFHSYHMVQHALTERILILTTCTWQCAVCCTMFLVCVCLPNIFGLLVETNPILPTFIYSVVKVMVCPNIFLWHYVHVHGVFKFRQM